MSHPISAFIPSVFIPVKNLKVATEWYANLLDRQLVPQADQDSHGIYIFDMEGMQLILDGNTWGSPPTIMFDTEDIDAAHAFCDSQPHEVLTDVYSDEYISVFNMNAHMICKANRDLGIEKAKLAHPLLNRISRIFLHADNLQETVQWYEEFTGRASEPDQQYADLPCIRMDRGADLLIDDNRLSQSPRVFFDKLQQDLRVNPILAIESPDLTAALEHVLSKGATAAGGIESRLGARMFQFQDPDGNAFLVCEKETVQ
jgi:hypothetical protein